MKGDQLKSSWADANQKALMAELALIWNALHRGTQDDRAENGGKEQRETDTAFMLKESLREACGVLDGPTTMDRLTELFGLSRFERAILLLCAGIELDGSFARICADFQEDRNRPHPTFSLALSILPEPHWSALSPGAPLRHWRLIEPAGATPLTTAPLRIDERILHYLTGVNSLDERLVGYLEAVPQEEPFTDSARGISLQLARAWAGSGGATLPVLQLCGGPLRSMRNVASAAATLTGCTLYTMPVERLPGSSVELEMLQRIWHREAVLSNAVLLLECPQRSGAENRHDLPVKSWVERNRSPLLVATPEPISGWSCPSLRFDITKPTTVEQRALWKHCLGEAAVKLNSQVERLVSQFDLEAPAISEAAARGLLQLQADGKPVEKTTLKGVLWDTCRNASRQRLDELALRIESQVKWDDLVVPERIRDALREIAVHVSRRSRVYDEWGFAAKSKRGLGITAMFSGASGTGKTLAAEVLANELELDLYRIDLSQTVSKYIGETEKNLARVFNAAEESGAVLLFDEADALFGRRSEVKDSHDRYANIEVSYLLQRMEAYRGLAILTTNMKDALDPAFLRRIRFIVQFPFPDDKLRKEIWTRAFPGKTPTRDLDLQRLSRLNLAGGNIRNLAMNAAFLAADKDEPVQMQHLVRAARFEFAKLEKPFSESDLVG